MKNENYNKSSTTYQRQQNTFLLFFIYGKGYILLESIVWKNVVYTITYLVKFSFSVAGYLKRNNETPTSI